MKNKAFYVLVGFSIAIPILILICPVFIADLFLAGVEGICIASAQKIWKKEKNIIDKKDNIEYCPCCGSHDIKIYREGYNYTKGFWLRTFDVKGGGYVAGMNSNRARCRCMNCGNDWATNYDYRLIDKK